jgi:general secretion pathway protein K
MILLTPSSYRRHSGAALLAVLWVIALLIGLVAGASLLLTQDLDSASAKRQIFRARTLAEGALAIAMNPDVKPDDPLLRRQLLDDEQYEVQMTGEDGLINPNVLLQKVDRETFRRIFHSWGMNLQQADKLIDAMLDWVDADDFKHINGAEKKEYGFNGMPFNRPFRNIEEMSMVRGMQEVEQAYPEWRTWFSVYASGMLDVFDARPEVISAVLGVDLRRAQSFRSQRLGRDGIMNTPDDLPRDPSVLGLLGIPAGSPQSSFVSVQSTTQRIVIRVRVGDLERELSAVTQGAIGSRTTAILWMSETNPIVDQTTQTKPITQ